MQSMDCVTRITKITPLYPQTRPSAENQRQANYRSHYKIKKFIDYPMLLRFPMLQSGALCVVSNKRNKTRCASFQK